MTTKKDCKLENKEEIQTELLLPPIYTNNWEEPRQSHPDDRAVLVTKMV